MIDHAKLILFACGMMALVCIVVAIGIVVTTMAWLTDKLKKSPKKILHVVPFIRRPKSTVCITPNVQLDCTGSPDMVQCWREHRDI